MDAWRPKHVGDYDIIKCLWKCTKLVALLWYCFVFCKSEGEGETMCPWRMSVSTGISAWRIKLLHVDTDYPTFNVSTALHTDLCTRGFTDVRQLVL
jgi:hypothetical protein